MVDFAGWEMPIVYTSIAEEHRTTRRSASVFDVSHMGRIELRGKDAEALLQRVCTRQIGGLAPGQSRYSHVCNEQGGVLDDVIVSRYEDHWLTVCNASNREQILSWLQKHGKGQEIQIADTTEATLMLAVQGPEAITKLSRLLPMPIGDLRRYHFRTGAYVGTPYSIFRTGYTGEDGVELILPATVAQLLTGFLESAQRGEAGLKPAGLGARDTLRLEAGLPLYGHELHEGVDPFSAGLGWCVDLNKDFIGAPALRQLVRSGLRQRLAGLQLVGRRIARQHAIVLNGKQQVGEVTSGTFSPTLERSIAIAYIESPFAEPGRNVTVDLGSKQADAVVVKLPFYER